MPLRPIWLAITIFYLLLTVCIAAESSEAQWAYLTPPWIFNEHDRYSGKQFNSIPLTEWKQEAAFDSAAHCERARLFAYTIRTLPQGHRERLLGIFAGVAEARAKKEAEPLIAEFAALEESWMRDTKRGETVRDINSKVIRQWNASKCVPFSVLREK
jgi:hypothetical protein